MHQFPTFDNPCVITITGFTRLLARISTVYFNLQSTNTIVLTGLRKDANLTRPDDSQWAT